MPCNVRNFWITLKVDGKKETVTTGPRNKNGGFDLSIGLRENGTISDKHLDVIGRVDDNGKLCLMAYVLETDEEIKIETNR